MKDRLSRWRIMIEIWEENGYCNYENQRSISYERLANALDKNPKTVRAILYRLVKRGYVEIVKIPRAVNVSGDFLGLVNYVLKKDGTLSKMRGRRRSEFRLSRKAIKVLSEHIHVDESGKIYVDVPISTITRAEALVILDRMKRRRRL